MILLLIYMTYGDVVLVDKRSFPRTKILHTKIHYTIFERVMQVIHRLRNAINSPVKPAERGTAWITNVSNENTDFVPKYLATSHAKRKPKVIT